MYLIIVNWAYQDDVHSATEIQERDAWSDGDLTTLEKGRLDGLSIWEFFQKKELTIRQVREILPGARFRLNYERPDDPRFDNLAGWKDINEQGLPLCSSGIQPLANYLKIPVLVFGTIDKYPRIPKMFFRCNPEQGFVG